MKASSFFPFKNIAILWRTFSAYRWKILTLVALGVVGAALDGIGINAIVPLISFYTNAGGAPTDLISRTIQSLFSFLHIPFNFRYLLGFILALFLLRAVTVTLFGYIRGWISSDFFASESESMLKRMLRASWPFLLKQKIGTLQATLTRDIQRMENLLQVFGQIIQSFTGFVIYLLIAMNLSLLMTVSTLVAGVVLLAVVRPLMSRAQATSSMYVGTEKAYIHFLSEHIIGMKAVKAAGVEERAVDSGGALVKTLRALSMRITLIRSMSGSLFQPFSLIFVIILFSLTYRTPGFSMISFAAALYLIQKIFTYLESGQAALHSVREAMPYVQNVAEFKKVLDEHHEASQGGKVPFRYEREIAFKEVSFAYAGGKEVLSGMSFAIPKGKTIGLVGPSGSGKTSVADLLLRMFTPTAGEILIDGAPSTVISTDSWRRSIGYVPQDAFLMNATLEENIRFYRSDISKEAIIAATKQANIYEFISGLPEGFETRTGDKGVMLSGGQRQRVALARALAGNPSVLILDEATSALDHESEKLIHESIRALHGTMAVFIIAHRPSTIAEADTILVIDHGRVVESGAPKDLLQNPDSYFYKMREA